MLFSLLMLFLSGTMPATAQEDAPISFRWELASLPQQDKILAVLWLIPDHGWHAYANDPGSPYAMPTTVKAYAQPKNPLPVYYPKGHPLFDQFSGEKILAYPEKTPVFITIPQKDFAENKQLQADVELLLCSNSRCQPLTKNMTLDLTAEMERPEANKQPWWPIWLESTRAKGKSPLSAEASLPAKKKDILFSPRSFTPGLEVSSLGKAAFFAFLAGLILNFMPCVLPVIALKTRTLLPSQNRTISRQMRIFRTHNLFFATGILVYFVFLATLFSFTGMVWGQLFQQPIIIIFLTFIVFALGLSLFGLYDLPVIDLKQKTASNPALESFLGGVLATLLATPCSGPFLGGVLAWGLLQPPLTVTLVFLCIGLGMASPYLLLASRPTLVRFLPKPGNWNVYLEQILGFFLLATCVYLVTLLPVTMIVSTLILLWLTALAAWVWGKFTSLSQSTGKRLVIRGSILLILFLSSLFLFQQQEEKESWQPFQQEVFLQSLGKKNIVLDFTADWCPNCKVLEKTILTPDIIAQTKKQYKTLFLQVDLTRNEKDKMALLKELGSQSIPVVALFSAADPAHPLILRDLFSKNQFKTALEQQFKKE